MESMRPWRGLFVLGLLTAGCDEEKGSSSGESFSSSSAAEFGSPPDEDTSGGGTLWACSFYGWGEDGYKTFEFLDELDFCFENEAAARSYTDTWTAECESAFLSDGFFSYTCEASCDNTTDGC